MLSSEKVTLPCPARYVSHCANDRRHTHTHTRTVAAHCHSVNCVSGASVRRDDAMPRAGVPGGAYAAIQSSDKAFATPLQLTVTLSPLRATTAGVAVSTAPPICQYNDAIVAWHRRTGFTGRSMRGRGSDVWCSTPPGPRRNSGCATIKQY